MLPRGVRVLQHRLSAVVILSDNVVSTQRENDQTFIGPIEAAWIRWRVRRSIAAVLANGKLSIIVLTLLAALIVAQRARTYDEPLENDVAGYAVIAREMLHARSLYSDLWERKPPLLYVIFAGAELTVGPGRPAVFLVNVMAATADLIAIYFAARIMSGVSAGLFASALWTILGGDLYLQANQPNAEALANPFITAAIAMLLFQLNRAEQRRWWFALLIGLLLGSATLIKHHLVLSAGIILAGFLLAGDRVTWKGRLRVITVSVTTITLCWAAVAIYFAVTNRLGPFVEILAGQNITYAGNPLLNVIHSLSRGPF